MQVQVLYGKLLNQNLQEIISFDFGRKTHEIEGRSTVLSLSSSQIVSIGWSITPTKFHGHDQGVPKIRVSIDTPLHFYNFLFH